MSPGSVVGRWTIESELPTGAPGGERDRPGAERRVFRARDGDEIACLKLLPPEAARAAAEEVNALRLVDHPCIARLVDEGSEPAPWLALAWVDGRALSEVVSPGRAEGATALPLLAQLLGALAHLHSRGLVHGDLRPENVLVDARARLTLVDLGLSRRLGRDDDTISGTLAYLAPETRGGGAPTPSSDLHAAGALFVEALAGEAALRALGGGDPPELPDGGDAPALRDLVHRLVAPEPSHRPASAGEALVRLLPELPDPLPPDLEHLAADAALRPATAAGVLREPRLVGRDPVLERLDAVLAATTRGEGTFVVVNGESGLGRTRLLAELERRARDATVRVLLGRCREQAAGGLSPLRDALLGLATELRRREPAEVAELVTADGRALGFACPEMLDLPYVRDLPEPADLSPDLNKFRVFSAVTTLLRNWSRREPLVLALDDVQWADDATVELIYYLQRNVVHAAATFGGDGPTGALTLVITRREARGDGSSLIDKTLADARRSGAFLEINLQRLSPDHVREIARDMLPGAAVPESLSDLVAAESGGSPQVAVELLTSLHDEGLLRQARGEWRLTGGPGASSGRLADMLRRRIDRVEPDARRLLEVGAVLGRDFDPSLASEVAGLEPDQAAAALESLVQARLLAPATRSRQGFVHEELRRLVLGETDEPERRSLHARVAAVLERRRQEGRDAVSTAELARHHVEADDVEGSLRHLREAAAELRAEGNAGGALELLRRHVAFFERLPRDERRKRASEALEARQAAADILARTGRPTEAADAFLDLLGACRGAGDVAAEARALVGLGMTSNFAGEYAEGREHLERALQLAEGAGAHREAVAARVYLVQNAYMQGRFDEGESHVPPALDAAKEIPDKALAAEALRQVGLFHHFRGRSEQAIPLYRDALRLLEQVGDRRNTAATLHNLGILHNARGEYHVAMDCYERSLATFRELGLRHDAAACLTNIGNVHLQQGAASEAERRYLEAQSIYREQGDRRASAENLSNLADVDLKRGDHARAAERHRQALAVQRDLGNRAGIAFASVNLAVALLHLGATSEARELVAEALEIDRELDRPRDLAEELAAAALLSRAAGDDEQALSEYREALEQAQRAGDRYHAALVQAEIAVLLADLGRKDEAHAEARQAYVEATSLGAKDQEVLALVILAEVGPADQSRERLARALEIVERLESPEVAWRAWHRAALLRAARGDSAGAAAAGDRAVELITTVARRLADDAAPFLARRDVLRLLDDVLTLEERSESPRVDALLERYHLLASEELRARAKKLLAARLGAAAPDTSELRRLRTFHDVVTSADPGRLDSLLRALVERVVEMVGAERGLLFLSSGSQLACRVAVARGGGELAGPEREVPRQVVEWVVRERRGMISEDAPSDARIDYKESVAQLRVRSLLAAPLVDGKDEILGVVYVDRRARGTRFDAEARADFESTCADLGRLVAAARRSEERDDEVRRLRERAPAEESEGLPGLIGVSPPMRRLVSTARIAAASGESVLVTGESGTGKEVLARALHAVGPRSSGPFVALDCGAVPETLIESVLFGHVKGAFTGADRDRAGLFEEASGGTLFLDEITNASREVQARLLRVLQEREVRRVGGRGTLPVDVRVVAATNLDVEQLVAEGRFREDLYYRLNVIHLEIPPLRERSEDVAVLAEHFLQEAVQRDGKRLEGFTEEAARILAAYRWPGNVRELMNCVARMAAFCTEGRVDASRIPERIRAAVGDVLELDLAPEPGADRSALPGPGPSPVADLVEGRVDFWDAVRRPLRERSMTKEQARSVVAEGLKRTGGSYKATARLFGLEDSEYNRFMDFLRFNDLKLDFRPFRRAAREK